MTDPEKSLTENPEIHVSPSHSELEPSVSPCEAKQKVAELPDPEPQKEETLEFTSPEAYVHFIRELIRTHTPPKAWMSIDMLEELLKEQKVPSHYSAIGYDSLEAFLADAQYKELWRTDKQYNSPFLIRHSYGKEIKQYIDTVAATIAKLYIESNRTPVALPTLVEKINQQTLSISYSSMGFPSFEVFVVDRRFATLWTAEKTPDFSIILQPTFKGRDYFLDKTYKSVYGYFASHKEKPGVPRLIEFFRRGAAGKLYAKHGYKSLEELAKDPFFAPLRNDNSAPKARREARENTGHLQANDSVEHEKDNRPVDLEDAKRRLADQVNAIYMTLAKGEGWVSLTAVASHIPRIKQKIQTLRCQSLSRFVQTHAEEEQWLCRYTNSTPPDFQFQWTGRPEQALAGEDGAESLSEDNLIAEISAQIAQAGDKDGWVLLAILGQYIQNLKKRLHALGYSALGTFVKEKAGEAGWTYCYFDDLASKLSIRLSQNGEPAELKFDSTMGGGKPKPRERATSESLLEPGYCQTLQFDDRGVLEKIAAMAEEEPWSFDYTEGYEILTHLLRATLVRAAVKGQIARYNEAFAFNTGLVTPEGTPIVAEVKEEKLEEGSTHLKLSDAMEFTPELDSALQGLPAPVRYFDFSNRTPLEAFLCNPDQPLPIVDWITLPGASEQSPEKLQAALEKSWQRLCRQLYLTVPCYDSASNEMHLLLPLYLETGENTPPMALELDWRRDKYRAVALHAIAEAYRCARTVSKITPSFLS